MRGILHLHAAIRLTNLDATVAHVIEASGPHPTLVLPYPLVGESFL